MASIDIVDRLRFDAVRCEATFSKGVAGNIEEAAAEIERLTAALSALRARFVEDRKLLQSDGDFGAASLLQTYINDIDQQQGGEK